MCINLKKYRILAVQFLVIAMVSSMGYAQQEAVSAGVSLDSNEIAIPLGSSYEEKLKYWNSLSDEQKKQIRKIAKTTSPETIRSFRQKADRFKNHPKELRERIKKNHRSFRKMSPQQRQAIRTRFSQRAKALREKLKKQATPNQRPQRPAGNNAQPKRRIAPKNNRQGTGNKSIKKQQQQRTNEAQKRRNAERQNNRKRNSNNIKKRSENNRPSQNNRNRGQQSNRTQRCPNGNRRSRNSNPRNRNGNRNGRK